MKVTVISVVVGALGRVPKGLKRYRGRIETIQNTALLSLNRIFRRVLETGGDSLSLKTPVNDHQLMLVVKNPQVIIIVVDFAVPAGHRVKLKESEKKDKCLDLVRKLKKQWNMKVTVILIVIGALGTVTKGLVQGLEIRDNPN